MAQNFKIRYEQTKKFDSQIEKLNQIPDPKLREQIKQQLLAPTYYELSLKNSVSLYKEIQNDKGDYSSENKNPNIKVMVVKNESTGIYQDFKTAEYVSGHNFFGKDFYIKDKVVKLDWKISDETKKIGNFNCKKATTTYEGKEVEAWYSEEIPVSVGPYVFNGLPGLIIQVNYDELTYNAISVEKIKELSIEKPFEKGKIVTRAEFEKIQKERL